MKNNVIVGLLVTVALVAVALFFLKDSIIFYSKNQAARDEYAQTHPTIFKKIINLGLDIQGGMRIVLVVDRANLPKDATGQPVGQAGFSDPQSLFGQRFCQTNADCGAGKTCLARG